MELTVTKKDIRTVRSISNEHQKKVDRLRDELGKKYLAQANLKMIVDKFREKTKDEIEVATATALQSWSKQAAELQVFKRIRPTRNYADQDFGSWIKPTAKQCTRI
jgi:hypothetical protein